MKNLISVFFLSLSLTTFAQHECGFDQIRMMGFIDETQYSEDNIIYDRGGVVTIPVVFHIVHKGEDVGVGTNISDEQILDALRIINEDLRKTPGTWGDGDGVDTELELCLAQRDPNGNPTTGINRIDGSQWSEYSLWGVAYQNGDLGFSDVSLKTATSWNRWEYLNVWLVSEINNNNGGGGIQGYANYPTMNIVDGIVMLHNVVGSIGNVKPTHNMSRTFAHEFGHYMGLYHTFEGYAECPSTDEMNCLVQGDRVCDTPPTEMGGACFPRCTNSQYQNYMDYTSQTCRNMFSLGQKNRMRGPNGLYHPARQNLIISQACVPLNINNLAIIESTYYLDCMTPSFTPQVKIKNMGTVPINQIQVLCTIPNLGYSYLETWNSEDSLTLNENLTIIFPDVASDYGTGFINFEILTMDEFMGDNFSYVEYISFVGNEMTLIVDPDFWESEINWNLYNSLGESVWSGGDYDDGVDNHPYLHIKCIPNGCYTMILEDGFGDGFGNPPNFGGFFELSDGFGNIITNIENNFGDEISFDFCLDAPLGNVCEDLNSNIICDYEETNIILGCMNPDACNFNPEATVDSNDCNFPDEIYDCNGYCFLDSDLDGICDQLEIFGCMDTIACNYEILSTENYGCIYSEPGYSCGGIPMSSLNTLMGIDELQEFHLIKEIIVFDATGRQLDPSRELSSGIYLIQIRFINGESENHKIFLN